MTDKRTSEEDFEPIVSGSELVRISIADSNAPSGWRDAATDVSAIRGTPSGGGGGVVNGGRLTLESGVPVSTTDQVGKTTLYWTPFRSNRVQLWDGTQWTGYESAQISIALGTLTNGLPYDVFMYENAGTPTLELLAWTNSTTRATALAWADGRLVKNGDDTRLYLGTIHTTSTTTTEDSLVNRLVWNYYNRVLRKLYKGQTGSGASHTYNGGYRAWNGNAAEKIQFVLGVLEDAFEISIVAENGAGSSGIYAIAGAQMDGNTAPDTFAYSVGVTGFSASGSYSYLPAVGFHYVQALESSASTGSANFVNYFLHGSLWG